jgi:uncharacterized protein (DUF2147 family)
MPASTLRPLLIGLSLAAATTLAWPQAKSVESRPGVAPAPVGVWKTIDDKTRTERAQIRLRETDGVITGVIEALLAPDADRNAVCDKCSDDRAGQPMIGLEVVRGVRRADSGAVWEGGTILDAAEGKVYRVRMTPIDGGNKLEVRGFVGTPLLGRTQTWIRVE